MTEPTALGMVLAMLVDPGGKPVGGPAKGQLYVSPDGVVVVRPTARFELVNRAMTILLVGSVAAVAVNLFTWKRMEVLWGAIVAQGVYWITMSSRRRALEPAPLTAGEIEGMRRAGRVAIDVPSSAIRRAVAPEPQRAGFRKPARFELADGALEVFLSKEQFQSVSEALGRG